MNVIADSPHGMQSKWHCRRNERFKNWRGVMETVQPKHRLNQDPGLELHAVQGDHALKFADVRVGVELGLDEDIQGLDVPPSCF